MIGYDALLFMGSLTGLCIMAMSPLLSLEAMKTLAIKLSTLPYHPVLCEFAMVIPLLAMKLR